MAEPIYEKKPNKPKTLDILISTLAAAFGVQSRKNLEKDFKHGNIYTYILSGVIFTIAFVLGVIFIVSQVLKSNGL
jgi:uncharacterized membrane protein YidH (DUF202 family)